MIKVKKTESNPWRTRHEKEVGHIGGRMMCGTFVGKVESWDASRQMREYKGSKMEAKGGGREGGLSPSRIAFARSSAKYGVKF